MGSGMGADGRLERSKGDSRQDNVHLEPGNMHMNNNNEGQDNEKRSLVRGSV